MTYALIGDIKSKCCRMMFSAIFIVAIVFLILISFTWCSNIDDSRAYGVLIFPASLLFLGYYKFRRNYPHMIY